MPLDGSAGYSENTRIKQEQLEVFLRTHLKIAGAKIRDGWPHPAYVYLDLNAGPGLMTDGHEGSPLIFLRVARELDVLAHAYLFERDPETVVRLRDAVGGRHGIGGWQIEEGDNAATVPAMMRRLAHVVSRDAYGLIYADPNATLMPVGAIKAALGNSHFKRVDVLVHLSGTGYKRQGAGEAVLEHLRSIGKRYIWLRRPREAWDWSFATLTNWDGFPEFRKQGIYQLGTPEGDDIAVRLSLTRPEYKSRIQGTLPFETAHPTEPTASIFDIPDSGPSGRLSLRGRVGVVSDAEPGHQLSLTT